jgi:hypothetical protein
LSHSALVRALAYSAEWRSTAGFQVREQPTQQRFFLEHRVVVEAHADGLGRLRHGCEHAGRHTSAATVSPHGEH